MNENFNAVFLNFIYQNSAMGVTTISQLLDIVEDEAFRKHLEKELEEYLLENLLKCASVESIVRMKYIRK